MKENEMNREWIITNKNGSYSSSSVSFANLRTYHGILVKNVSPYYDRVVLLSKLFEIIYFKKQVIHLDTNYYPQTLFPDGYKYIEDYEIFPIPVFTYVINDLKIKKSLVMCRESDNVFIHYEFLNGVPEKIELFPLVSFRSNHSVIKKGIRSFVTDVSNEVTFSFSDLYVKILSPGKFIKNEDWYYNFQYPVEKERGTNSEEDLFNPGYFEIENPSRKFTVEITGDKITGKDFKSVRNSYIKNMDDDSNIPFKKLAMSSKFLITRDDIIAGYYWFGPWARDAFISLPGLLLVRKRYDEAKSILLKYAASMKNDIIPKLISAKDDYVTADTSLWFIYAVYKYYQYTHNKDDLSIFYPYIKEIINSYIKGNEKFELDDNFIRTKDAPLSWMDANFGNRAMTPRIGLPVEINALWYNSISTIEYFDKELGLKTETGIYDIKESLENRFSDKFFNNGKVLDVADPDDFSFRPNFIFAFSLPFPVMHNFIEFKKNVDEELLTPYGLRTLSPKDPKFESKYEGDWYSRDKAYHNGTVWPWLVGPYITSSIKAGEKPKKILRYFRALFNLTYVPEIFDGENPKEPKGCIIQAWSYGELLRAYFEDILSKMGE